MISPDYIQQGLVRRGLPAHIAQGFVMNMQDESGLNPGINEISPTVQGSRGGYGLYQLTGPRRVAYEAYAQRRGTALDDADAQLDFLMSELQSTEKNAAQSIFSTSNPQDAAVAIARDFLRPSASNLEKRVNRYKGSSSMMQQEPKGLLGSLGIQKMEEGAAGETGQRFYERDSFKDTAATLAQGFAALGSRPGLQKMANDVAAQRSETKSKNKTAQYLRENGMGDMADMLMAGNIGARDVMAAVMKKRLEGPAKLSEKEQRIERLMSTGLSRDVAIGIADGRLELSRDPITGEAIVVDLGAPSSAAGATAEPAATPEGEPAAENGGTFADTNVEGATGVPGFLRGAVNTVVDAFGGDQPYEKVADAQSKLNLLSTQTTLGMAAEFPGRPSNLTREEVRKLTILPSEITTGPDKALNKAEALLDMVGKQLAAAQAVVNGSYSPQDKSKAQASIRYLAPLLEDYNSLVSRLSEQRSPDAQQSGQAGVAIRSEVADRLEAYK